MDQGALDTLDVIPRHKSGERGSPKRGDLERGRGLGHLHRTPDAAQMTKTNAPG